MGTGYVGLVSGACLAEIGHHVICVDTDERKVRSIRAGRSPLVEKGLDDLLVRLIGNRLDATTDLDAAVRDSDVTFIAVGTPYSGDAIDLSQVRHASADIGRALAGSTKYHVVAVKSTVVPGTTDDVVRPILEQASGRRAAVDFGVGMNPEFLREGDAVDDFMHPDRIVIGAMDDRARSVLHEVYRPFHAPIVDTGNRAAEMIKYASNALLATAISFTNEIANLSAAVGVDAMDVMPAVHLDRRLSPVLPDGSRVTPGFLSYLLPGCGFGGSCFPKDVRALVAFGRERGLPMALLSDVMAVNQDQHQQVLERIRRHHPDVRGLRVAILGVAFKPGTDDVRESPALPIIADLRAGAARVGVFDPVAAGNLLQATGWSDVVVFGSLADAVKDSDVLVLVTRWPDFDELPRLVTSRHLVVDGRRMLDRRMPATYEGIGL